MRAGPAPASLAGGGATSSTLTLAIGQGVTLGSSTFTITGTDAAAGRVRTATCTLTLAPLVAYLTSVQGDDFPPGQVGGTTAGFGYQVSTGSGYGPLVVAGITEDVPGTSVAEFQVAQGAPGGLLLMHGG